MCPTLKQFKVNKNRDKNELKVSLIMALVIALILMWSFLPKDELNAVSKQLEANKSGIEEIVREDKSLFELKEQASPEKRSESSILDEIYKQADRYGVERDLALKIAICESNLDPRAKNPSSTAKGIYQFISSTWENYCDGNVFNYKDNITCFMIYYPMYSSWWESCINKI